MRDEESTARHSVEDTPPSRTWLWASLLAVAMMVAAALLYFFVVREKNLASGPLPTRTVTVEASSPVPSISPSPREQGTAFYDRLPDTVGAYVLIGTAANPEWEALGAFDAYTVTYSDGVDQITLLAGQWRSDSAAAEAFESLGGPEGWPGPDSDLASKNCPPPAGEDTGAIWVNRTAIFKIDTPKGEAAQFFCRMPM